MPAVEMATKMPGRPPGAKPWLVKFAGPPIPPTPMSAQTTKTATTSTITIELPPHEHVVDLREQPHPVGVHRHEHGEQDRGDEHAERGQHVHLDAVRLRRLGERGVLRRVGERALDLDRGHRRRRDPGDEAERVGGEGAPDDVRIAHDAAGDREHRPELRVGEPDEHDHDPGDQPGEDRRRARDGGGVEGAEEPARPDDGADRGEQEPEGPTSRFNPVPVFADLDSSTFVTDVTS